MKNTKKVRVRSARRRRHYGSAIDRYTLEARMESLYRGCKTVAQLRERYRQLAEDDSFWQYVQDLKDNQDRTQETLQQMEESCQRIAGRNPTKKIAQFLRNVEVKDNPKRKKA